MYSNCVA